jgi:hypothetical protein
MFALSVPPQFAPFLGIARYVDDMLAKMGLRNLRGATGFIWQMGEFSIQQLQHLKEERDALRKEYALAQKKAN